MRTLLLLLMAGAVLVGCSGGDVSSNDVKSKEQQIADASHKLNGNQPQQDQSQD